MPPSSKTDISQLDRIHGMFLGTAVGDSLGLPAEGLTPQRIRRWYGEDWQQRLIGSWGMVSDDTDHTVFLAQSLIQHPNNSDRFVRRLARSLRWWLVGLPPGIGFGTLRAIAKLWLGISPHKSGIFTAGNGPAMRIAPIGAMFSHDAEKLEHYVKISTRLTHTDPKATTGALAIARTIARIFQKEQADPPPLKDWIEEIRQCGSNDTEWQNQMDVLEQCFDKDESVQNLAIAMGLPQGVTGYMYHTVPVALYAWYRHFGDFATTLTNTLSCGGDTDTTGAIVGALAGATVGASAIPQEWYSSIKDWPHNPNYLRKLSKQFAQVCKTQQPGFVLRRLPLGVPLRNMAQLMIVLYHGFRRLLPPY